jgi:hypothetical protein
MYRVEHRFSGAGRTLKEPASAAEVTENLTSGAKAQSKTSGVNARLKGVRHPSYTPTLKSLYGVGDGFSL